MRGGNNEMHYVVMTWGAAFYPRVSFTVTMSRITDAGYNSRSSEVFHMHSHLYS